MTESIHIEAIEKVLSAIYPSGHPFLSSFFYSKPGVQSLLGGLGAEICAHQKDYTDAILFIRRTGCNYLKFISISEIRTITTRFLIDNFWYISSDAFWTDNNCAYISNVSRNNINILAEKLSQSALYNSSESLILYPLQTVEVEDEFISDEFFLCGAANFSKNLLPSGVKFEQYNMAEFPPLVEAAGKRISPRCWLGIKAPLAPIARKMKSSVLGAMSLTIIPRERYLFTGRELTGGKCTINPKSMTYNFSNKSSTPSLSSDIKIDISDRSWLKLLAKILSSNDGQSRSQIRSLEYFYRAWFLEPSERFPILCMSLDSLVNKTNNHTKEAIKFIDENIKLKIDLERLRLLLNIRGAVIHGAAPDVYESDGYESYYVRYGADPVKDLDLIVGKCIREYVFEGKLNHHPDPHADITEKVKKMGRIMPDMRKINIIPDDI
ncbi:hypothetical protein [Methylobacterium bullatum]|uniref:Apea-like HEPN domain-containing protein n=1 Tax=Methylobacterium bullatum TaxID=570505 RepID=A0A679KCX1_9HYPH|nr:hypothetical protein MBLL_04207 [Methylobacterium bullatum]